MDDSTICSLSVTYTVARFLNTYCHSGLAKEVREEKK